MRIVYDIEKLKADLIGKTINWVTVTDVFKDSHNHTVCSCICKCGNTFVVPIKIINSGKIKSCGCYKHSREFAEHISNWCKDNPDKVALRASKYKQWATEHADKIAEQGKRHSQLFLDNPELVAQYRERMIALNKSFNKDASRDIRISSISKIIDSNPSIIDIIYKDDLHRLLSGDITSSDKIRVRCPICNEYSFHNAKDIFNISNATFKQARMCSKCFSEFSSSKYEQEIADYISTFYNGSCIRNSRTILDGKELDLYYPEKKIAIEFNGDYWHSSLFKDSLYHYNKLRECLNKQVLLVSIFESYWLSNKIVVEDYLYDLFFNKNNSLSLINGIYINNNFPPPSVSIIDLNYNELCYLFNGYKVYTCGYSIPIKSITAES